MGRHNHRNTGVMLVLGVVFFVFLIANLFPFLVLGGIGAGIYYLSTQKSRQQKKLAHHQLQLLTSNLQKSEQEIQHLERLLEEQHYLKFEHAAKNLLQKLSSYSYLVYSMQKHIDIREITSFSQRITQQTSTIQEKLKRLQIPPESQPATSEEDIILRMAPEIIDTYRNIQKDHHLILQRLKEAKDQGELETLHNLSMERFRDILDGYLKIKESPKDFYHSEERLKQAHQALRQFDLDLDETLRRLNESQLQDFEISLRRMNALHTDKDFFSDSDTEN